MVFKELPSKAIRGKYGSSKGKSLVGPKSWSKVIVSTKKRKVVSSSDYEFKVGEDVQDIIPIKKYASTKTCAAILEKNVERWKYVDQRRIALEKELAKGFLKCKEIVDLIEDGGLMRTVTSFHPCYEGLVKQFVVSVPDGYDDVKSKDYRKINVRGNVVTFSPAVITKFLDKFEEPQAKLEDTDDQVCKEITGGHEALEK